MTRRWLTNRDTGGTTAANFSAGLGINFGSDGNTETLVIVGVTFELGLGRN